ncbi:Dabb family protein [Paenibacillus sp. S-38]|uniref:Dabb family protein n=1 Tax=Paenibacillus sp. S-38 TaxID=3416710 RepID=UPI003CF11B1B
MKSQSIRHMVIFCLKHAEGSPAAEQFLEDGRAQLTSIPGVTRFEVLRQVSPKNDYDYGFSMDFADAAAYEAYNAHPVHTAFVSERWEKEVTRFLEIDFQTLPARV